MDLKSQFNKIIGRSEKPVQPSQLIAEFEKLNSTNLSPAQKQTILNAANKLAKKDPAGFLAAMVQWQHASFAKEIQTVKDAIDLARHKHSPSMLSLMEVYYDINCDAFINGIVEKNRILKLSNRRFKMVDENQEANPELAKMLRKSWFNWFIKEAMRSRFYGFSLVYFSDWENGEIKKGQLVPRTHVIPRFNKVVYNPLMSHADGFDFTQPPYSNYCIGIGDATDLGDFEKAAMLWVIKKHSWSAWDRFEELFGVPLRIAKTASTDKKVIDSIYNFLNDMGTAGFTVLPQDSEIDIQQSSNTDSYQVFNEKRKAANEELEILLTGQRRITLDTGSLAKEQVLQLQTEEVIEDDKVFLTNVINDHLLPMLRLNGYKIPDGVLFQWDDAKELEPLDRLKVYESAQKLGFTPNRETFAQEFGIELADETAAAANPTVKNYIKLHEQINNLYTGAAI